MFGRELAEQAEADAVGGDRTVPVIVEKCIQAVEVLGKDFPVSSNLLRSDQYVI